MSERTGKRVHIACIIVGILLVVSGSCFFYMNHDQNLLTSSNTWEGAVVILGALLKFAGLLPFYIQWRQKRDDAAMEKLKRPDER